MSGGNSRSSADPDVQDQATEAKRKSGSSSTGATSQPDRAPKKTEGPGERNAGLPEWLLENGSELFDQEQKATSPQPAVASNAITAQASQILTEKPAEAAPSDEISLPTVQVIAPVELAEAQFTAPVVEPAAASEGAVPGGSVTLGVQGMSMELTEMKPVAAQGDEALRAYLIAAKKALAEGNTREAAEKYAALLNAGQFVPEIIRDLEEAYNRPITQVLILKSLAQAYEKSNRLQEALAAYKKALDLWVG